MRSISPKIIHLLRHAKAEPAGARDDLRTDHARALAKRGEKAAAALAEHLAKTHFAVDRIYCSTAIRARQTLAPLRDVLPGTPASYRDALYMIDEENLLDFFGALPDSIGSVLMIGHNPTFHEVALSLVAKAATDQSDALRTLKVKFPTGTLCSISCDVAHWSKVTPKSGTLTGFLRPKDLLAE